MLFWGLRGLGRIHLFEVERPQVVLEVAGRRVESEVLASYRESPNFTELVQHVTVVRRGPGHRLRGRGVKVKDAVCSEFQLATLRIQEQHSPNVLASYLQLFNFATVDENSNRRCRNEYGCVLIKLIQTGSGRYMNHGCSSLTWINL